MKTFSVTIATPEKTVYKREAVSLIVPGELGFFGIWANHMPFISSITIGRIILKKNESSAHMIFQIKQNGGILEVLKNKVALLSEDIVTFNESPRVSAAVVSASFTKKHRVSLCMVLRIAGRNKRLMSSN